MNLWIVKLEVSLNELEELRGDSLLQFVNLLELDASLNSLTSIDGVGVLANLVVLNLSYNAIKQVKAIGKCTHLAILNISHNQITTLKDFSTLTNLAQLHLDSNKLESLDGIQYLSQLHELYVENNEISSLLPLSSSLTLNVLDASNNKIQSLVETVHVLSGLYQLTQLKLKGNLLTHDNRYSTAIKQNTMVQILDNHLLKVPTNIQNISKHHLPLRDSMDHLIEGGYTREGLKDIAKQSFMEKLQSKHKETENRIHHFHGRILELQEDLKDYEHTLRAEMQSCIRYIDALPQENFNSIEPSKVPRAMEQYLFTKFWDGWEHGKRKPQNLPFKELKNPEEVVKAAAWLLSHPPTEAISEDS
ncbi:leucine-rich repeat neuronal protein 1-like [Xenopus laevis]|uniref:Leucine-rich repeat neuronal protein 1-like n=1 Tax=Xenopus laevis TaxID=8355 RepID=A0A8J1MID3_XENLA|nr:leucine-rich repeat neuronal protein 1-like [Xenopus laevis]